MRIIDVHPDVVIAVSEVVDGTMKAADEGRAGADAVAHELEARANRRDLVGRLGLEPHRTARVRITYDRDDFCQYRLVSGGESADVRESVADALATTASAVPLLLPVADCMPVVLFDSAASVVMLSHLGRHSVEQHGGTRMVRWLAETVGIGPRQVIAWLGPSPNGRSYPLHRLGSQSFEQAVTAQLRAGGVPGAQIIPSRIDTVTNSEFFSHSEFLAGRRASDGRYAVVVARRGAGQ